MADRSQRKNKETRKPKADKKAAGTAAPVGAKPGLLPQKDLDKKK